MSDVTRRGVIGAAVAAAGGLVAGGAEADQPKEDHGPPVDEIPNFRFDLERSHAKIRNGGSAKEATIRQLPISKGLAGVSMRLKPGGFRELHWHAIAAEWAYVFKGRVRATVIDPAGDWEILDFAPGDLWYFPRGHGHALWALGPDEAHFLLGFDDGAFSEHGTFSVSDWLALTPPEVLAKNLRVPPETFAAFPKREIYIGQGPVPPPLPEDPPAGSLKSSPLSHKYRLQAQAPRTFPGGELRIASAKEFPISTTMTGATMLLKPGALRELHWHPNADEWVYFVSGRARMALFGSGGRAKTLDFGPGEVAYVPRGFGHYIDNIGEEDCRMVLIFNSGSYQEIALTTWLATNPRQLLAANFGVAEEVVARFPRVSSTITSKDDRRP
jgi:oxalate decarboxylase